MSFLMEEKSGTSKKDNLLGSGTSASSSLKGSTSKSKSRRRTPSPPRRINRSPGRSRKKDGYDAWTSDRNQKDKRPARPQTAKHRSSSGDNRGRNYPKERSLSKDSDSDMTDVSPINSPRNTSSNGLRRDAGEKYNNAIPKKYQAMPLSDGASVRNVLETGDSQQPLDLNILMKAVSELEREKRVSANTRRVMFEPMRPLAKASRNDKQNYTFNDSDTYRYEIFYSHFTFLSVIENSNNHAME